MTGRVAVTAIRRLDGGVPVTDHDLVAVESPLALDITQPSSNRLRSLGLLMRTPGDDRALVFGLLRSEGIIRHRVDVAALEITPAPGETEPDRAHVTLAPHVAVDLATAARALDSTSACGLCGRVRMLVLDHAGMPAPDHPRIHASVIAALPTRLREGQAVFDETGGLHAAAACSTAGDLRIAREDIGRHNAVDKVIGALMLDDSLPAHDAVLVVSGRVAFEIVQKAGAAGFPIVIAIGAPSSLAVEAARAAGLTLAGFVRDGRFNIYTGADRVISAS